VLLTRHINGGHGVGNVGGFRNLDRSLPRDLVIALHEGLVRTTKTGTRSERAAAMNRLGVFFLEGFGTAKSFQKAFSWFCLAAEHGSVEARKMVFPDGAGDRNIA
jgi:TPR repeat protein